MRRSPILRGGPMFSYKILASTARPYVKGTALPTQRKASKVRGSPWRSSGNQIDTASFIKGKDLDDRTVSEVQRKFHAYARTSSFTKCKRKVVGSLSS